MEMKSLKIHQKMILFKHTITMGYGARMALH